MTPKKQLKTLKSLGHAIDCAHEAYEQYAYAPGTTTGNREYARYEKWNKRTVALYDQLRISLEAAASVDQRTLKRR